MMNLIPKPSAFKEFKGSYKIEKNAPVFSEIELALIKNKGDENAPVKILLDTSLAEEEYRLTVNENGVLIKASSQAGAYYALQSVRMLGRFDEGKNEIPYVEISDKPQYKWRGLALDESRHFFGKDSIKTLLDDMFRLKLNVFHWHLTDDQGWRIEIKKYPLLTEIGSKRAFTQLGGWQCSRIENKEYSGFYTQEDIKEIVEYAAERCISIMPEIDVPAHFAAALASYPNLACRNIKRDVFGAFGSRIFQKEGIKDWNRPICLGKKESLDFIFDVYEEVMSLFPFEYFHVGGDECDVTEWKTCPDCQKALREYGFKDEKELQKKLTNELCAFLESKGKHMVAWNDVLRKGIDNIDKNTVVQQWLPGQDKNTKNFAANGGKIIMSNHRSFYFDMPYAKYPLSNTYDFSPSQFGVEKENVIGVEGELWTEWIRTFSKIQFMAHPRMEALSEVAWTAEENRDFTEFYNRYNGYKGVLDKLGINYAKNEICMPKNPFKRLIINGKFFKGDPDFEFTENNKLKEIKK